MKRLFLGVVLTIIIVSPIHAQSTLALQEKCAEGAKKFFSDSEKVIPFVSQNKELGYWYDEYGFGNTDYIPHYNRKFDKCFMLIKTTYNHTWESRSKKIRAKREDQSYSSAQGLFNVFEGTQVGEYDALTDGIPFALKISRCYVGNKTCKSLEEFEAMIKPYMEE